VKRLLVVGLTLLVSASAFAWGEKGHFICNEAATFGLPADMPQFFHRAYPELIFLAYDPDRWRGAGESLDAANPPDHFLDAEFVAGMTLPNDRYKFIDLLYRTDALRRHGISNSSTGFLPWKIAEMSDLLTSEFRQWRFARPPERAAIERDIIHVAGILGHYGGDSSNPHHATINFNGWVEPNPNHYPTDCDTHTRFETRFVSHAIDLADVTPLVKPAQLRTDYFAAALESVRASQSLIETLYRMDRDGAFDVFRPVSPEAKRFTAERLAAGASLIRDLWWSAWQNSAKPPKRQAPVD
jgi:hypothetical protein